MDVQVGTLAGARKRRETSRYPAAVKCSSRRRDGSPCGRWATRGARVCETHGARLPTVKEAAAKAVSEARDRLRLMHDPAVETLTQLMGDEDPKVRLGALALLHRVSPLEVQRSELEVTVRESPTALISQRLKALSARMGESQALEAALVAPETLEDALAADGGEVLEGELVDDWA